jgi:UDP-N-acetyl-D-glucosamine dehydrogenase
VTYSDPYVASIEVEGRQYESEDLAAAAAQADCVVIVTDHTAFDYGMVVEKARLIVDTRNALRGICSDKIVRL